VALFSAHFFLKCVVAAIDFEFPSVGYHTARIPFQLEALPFFKVRADKTPPFPAFKYFK
jgi:hypothetical protein